MTVRWSLKFHNEWFLWLCPAFLVMRGVVRFPASVHWLDALLLFFEYSIWSTTIALLLVFLLPFRKAALLSAALVLFNALYSMIYEYGAKHEHRLFLTRFGFVASVALVLFGLFLFYLRRTQRKFNQATRFLNVLFFVLIATEVVSFGAGLVKRNNEIVEAIPCRQCPTPDVYLIITDGYAGKKQLREQFGLDNTPFEDTLRRLGFFVVDSSISNYSATSISMSSVLRMNYVTIEKDADIHAPFNPNSVTSFFKKQGYTFVNNSFFQIDGQFPKQPTDFLKTGPILLTQHSFVAHASFVIHNLLATIGYSGELKRLKRITEASRASDLRRDSMSMQNLIATVKSADAEPKFVYTHFMMPHYPYLFDEQGRQLKDTGTYSSQYKSYHKYTNKQLLYAVKSVLQLSKKPPIILLLSDHGSRIDDWTEFGRLRFYNLAAVYLPDKAYDVYYKGMSNVNQFRVLFNNQFGQSLPLLPDSTVQ